MCLPNNHRNQKPNKQRRGSRNRTYPPQTTASIKFRHKFRWIADQTDNDFQNTSQITSRQILDLLVQGTTLGGSYAIIRSCRIVDAEMWALFGGTTANGVNPGSNVSLSIEYPNSPNLGPGGPDARRSDVAMGVSHPGHVHYSPPRSSLSGMWLNRNDEYVLIVRFPRGAVLDLTLEIVLEDSPNVNSVGTTGAIPGQNYLLSLDHGVGGYFWTPVDYNTTQ